MKTEWLPSNRTIRVRHSFGPLWERRVHRNDEQLVWVATAHGATADEAEQHARTIATSVNRHDVLVGAIEAALRFLDAEVPYGPSLPIFKVLSDAIR